MHRSFNTAGPVRPGRDYCVPPLERFDLDEVLGLIRTERYFVLHAPRQTGKTSSLLALRDLLNGGAAGDYRCAYINVETAQTAREDVGRAMSAIAVQIAAEAEDALGDPAFAEEVLRSDAERRPHSALWVWLRKWAKASPPLVLMIDEVDAMVGDSLVSVLRQLRTGYAHRPEAFPQSVILCGVRDVRDYRIRASSEREVIAGGSAFNIKAESLRLGDLTRAEVETLLGQHTAETGQEFAPAAVEAVWTQTRGQPWLVNALARQLCFKRERPLPRGRPISERDVFEARETLILRRDTHIDQLADKLREPRVRRVVEPLPRVLTSVLQDEMPRRTAWYVGADGALDMDGPLSAFQEFFRGNSEHWIERARYREAGPQLVLQAFLHRVVNGRGRIEREYALGSRRVDLLVVWPAGDGRESRFVVECKVVREGRSHARTVENGLEQTAAYMDLSGTDAGHMIVFDMRAGRTWADKVFREERTFGDARITVWGA